MVAIRIHGRGGQGGVTLAKLIATSRFLRSCTLGTRAVPIVNTALAGATARMLDIPLDEMLAALDHMGFGGGNIDAARDAHESVVMTEPARKATTEQADVRPAPAAVPTRPDRPGGNPADLP